MSKILKIVCQPDPILRRHCSELSARQITSLETQNLIDDMIATMWDANGVGLAAPQIGLNIRLIIISEGRQAIPVINPRILKCSWAKDTLQEGCLSVPGFYGMIRRHRRAELSGLDRAGKKINIKGEGLLAEIIQHEVDHINGLLYIDKIKKVIPIEEEDLRDRLKKQRN
jgi:peptide deformylase